MLLFLFFLNRQRCNIPSHQQVSLARSSLVKDGDGLGDRLLLTSYDRTLVVKKITSEEVADMHNILSEYHQVRHINKVLSYLLLYRDLLLFFIRQCLVMYLNDYNSFTHSITNLHN